MTEYFVFSEYTVGNIQSGNCMILACKEFSKYYSTILDVDFQCRPRLLECVF